MHPNMHLLHLHVTAVIAPPSPLPPVYVGNPSCKASRPVAERGGWFRLAGSTGKKILGCCEALIWKDFMPPGLAATCIAFIAVT